MTRILTYIIIALFIAFNANAQGKRGKKAKEAAAQEQQITPLSADESVSAEAADFDPNAVEIEPDVYPQINGGATDFLYYVASNMQYPEAARQEGVEGKVMVLAVIGPDGKVREAEIQRGIRQDIDEEALRLVREMPNWYPAEKSGRAVASKALVMVPFAIKRNPEPFK